MNSSSPLKFMAFISISASCFSPDRSRRGKTPWPFSLLIFGGAYENSLRYQKQSPRLGGLGREYKGPKDTPILPQPSFAHNPFLLLGDRWTATYRLIGLK